ncbi:putative membrane protein [Neisseria musculi]|uniref:Membrane protein n=1 Tax=Neisseria musculi TaxID=1815583 RepID=A0A7H1MAZ1_9NEIS|nr:putative membrane protein [Neisseria musculi]
MQNNPPIRMVYILVCFSAAYFLVYKPLNIQGIYTVMLILSTAYIADLLYAAHLFISRKYSNGSK